MMGALLRAAGNVLSSLVELDTLMRGAITILFGFLYFIMYNTPNGDTKVNRLFWTSMLFMTVQWMLGCMSGIKIGMAM